MACLTTVLTCGKFHFYYKPMFLRALQIFMLKFKFNLNVIRGTLSWGIVLDSVGFGKTFVYVNNSWHITVTKGSQVILSWICGGSLQLNGFYKHVQTNIHKTCILQQILQMILKKVGYHPDYELTKTLIYHNVTGELWSVFFFLGEILLCYKEALLYL